MGLLDDAIREHLDLKRRRGADPAEVERAEHEALGPVRRDSLTASVAIDDRSLGLTGNAEPHRLALDEPAPQTHRRRGLLRRRHTSEPDRHTSEPDRHTSEPDRHTSEPDRHTPEPDRHTPEPDRHTPEPDWHAPEPDFHPDPVTSSPGAPAEDLRDDSPISIDAREPEPTTTHLAPEQVQAPDPAVRPAPASSTPPPVAAPGSSPPAPDDPHETAEYDIEAAFAASAEPTAGDVLEETPEFLQDTPEHDRLWFEQRPPRDFDFDG